MRIICTGPTYVATLTLTPDPQLSMALFPAAYG
jgi:hypothetical protein